MQRRSILKSLGLLPLGLFIPKLINGKSEFKVVKAQTLTNVYEHRGFKYFWSGWKHDTGSVRLYGQWIAVNKKDIRIYSGSNGTHGQYLKGSCFSLTTISPRELIEIDSLNSIKELHKSLALEDLVLEINKYHSEKKNPFINAKKPEYKFGFTGFKNS